MTFPSRITAALAVSALLVGGAAGPAFAEAPDGPTDVTVVAATDNVASCLDPMADSLVVAATLTNVSNGAHQVGVRATWDYTAAGAVPVYAQPRTQPLQGGRVDALRTYTLPGGHGPLLVEVFVKSGQEITVRYSYTCEPAVDPTPGPTPDPNVVPAGKTDGFDHRTSAARGAFAV